MSNSIQHMAKTLRKRLTDAEKILWKHLKAKQTVGCKFRRQEPVGKYIVDFVCYGGLIAISIEMSEEPK